VTTRAAFEPLAPPLQAAAHEMARPEIGAAGGATITGAGAFSDCRQSQQLSVNESATDLI
jgi:hypothetical protein